MEPTGTQETTNVVMDSTNSQTASDGTTFYPVVGTREDRGREIAGSGKIRPCGIRWSVPSQSDSGRYIVDLINSKCTCPDFELRGLKCKHQHAVEFFIISQSEGAMCNVAKLRAKRRTYAQAWASYNAAQVYEKEHFEELLYALCEGIRQPPYVRGRPRVPLRDMVFAIVHKVYTMMSGRRAQSDLRTCHELGLIENCPAYNSIFRYMEAPALTPILVRLVEDSAAPLASLETHVIADSTGFGTTTYQSWFHEKYGEQTGREWVKCHAMSGEKTNVIAAVMVSNAADCPTLPALLDSTAKRFRIEEVSADKAYLSHYNVDAINAIGATPYIPFKENSTGEGPETWRKMYAHFMLKRPDFLAHYHKRSNVETTFHMVKAKFGAFVRAKLPVARKNEVLAKCLCHNLCCLIEAIFKTGLQPDFWRSAA